MRIKGDYGRACRHSDEQIAPRPHDPQQLSTGPAAAIRHDIIAIAPETDMLDHGKR